MIKDNIQRVEMVLKTNNCLEKNNNDRGKEDGESQEFDQYGNIIFTKEYIEENENGEWFLSSKRS